MNGKVQIRVVFVCIGCSKEGDVVHPFARWYQEQFNTKGTTSGANGEMWFNFHHPDWWAWTVIDESPLCIEESA